MIRIPAATYRLQLNRNFNLQQAIEIADYLNEIGITDCYASPIFAAAPGSLHGYNISDYSKINPELGTYDDFSKFSQKLKKLGMGLIVDIVPNHMWVGGASNVWWDDVLENGPSSRYAKYFDIDWNSPVEELRNKVLLPILEKQYGQVIDNQEIKIVYDEGRFVLRYGKRDLPLNPSTWDKILSRFVAILEKEVKEDDADLLEVKSLAVAIDQLPNKDEIEEEINFVKKRLKELLDKRKDFIISLEAALKAINGDPKNPLSFLDLEEILDRQAYRLSFWRVASDEINYRRFFDINELAGVRTELKEVFEAIHKLLFQMVAENLVTGFRVDHVDGLLDPEQYLKDLQAGYIKALGEGEPDIIDKNVYIVVEKILLNDEKLNSNWLIHGSTGYDFLKYLNCIFIDSNKKTKLDGIYFNFIANHSKFSNVLYESKKQIINFNMVSELQILSRRLDRIAEQHRSSKDFTLESLRLALADFVACFPIYRTYIRSEVKEIDEADKTSINYGIRHAKRRNAALSPILFDFIHDILLLKNPEGLTEAQIITRRNFILDFQQFTSPVMAKGLEDTAFYRYYPLVSLNEVGSDVNSVYSLDDFHRHNMEQQKKWPHTFCTTSTHDTKRGEDIRARLNVLSEIPEEWQAAILKWNKINLTNKKSFEGVEVPDTNEEYLLYQTLVGTWPFEIKKGKEFEAYAERMCQYMNKALREAKINSSWINPNLEYEEKVRTFIFEILNLNRENQFVNDMENFVSKIRIPGICNSLSQLLLKITSPGVPDFYQGTELWDFSLVDPDNRQVVDYAIRKGMVDRREPQELMQYPEDGAIKLFIMRKALNFRRKNIQLYQEGSYEALSATGEKKSHVIAFQRKLQDKTAVTLVGRFYKSTPNWENTYIELEEGNYKEIITGKELSTENKKLKVESIFKDIPVALLEKI